MGELFQALASDIPAVLCLIFGYALVVVEMCIPGFGVPGTLGIILLIAGVSLGAATVTQALILAGIVVALLLIALPICIRFIGKGRFAKSKLVLQDVSVPVKGAVHELDQYLGREGVTLTALRPAGLGEFEGGKLNIVSDGAFIAEGSRVKVLKVEGNRVVVDEVRQSN